MFETTDKTGYGCSTIIDVSSFTNLYVFVPNTEVSKTFVAYLAKKDGTIQETKTFVIQNVDNTGDWVEFEIGLPITTRKVGFGYVLGYDLLVYGV